MGKYAFEMKGDNPVGLWGGTGSKVPANTVECTALQAREYSAKHSMFEGSAFYRWTYIADDLLELDDPRARVTWVVTEDNGVTDVDGNIVIDTTDDQPSPKITLRHEDGRHNQVDIAMVNKRLMKLDFINGDALIELRSFGYPRHDTYTSCDLFDMANTLRIRVAAVML